MGAYKRAKRSLSMTVPWGKSDRVTSSLDVGPGRRARSCREASPIARPVLMTHGAAQRGSGHFAFSTFYDVGLR